MKKILLLISFLLISSQAFASIVTKTVEYMDGTTLLEGYIAYDDSIAGKRPTVLIVHEWKGLEDYEKRRAEQLAAKGYVGFVIDLYGKGIHVKDHKEAAALSGIYRNDRSLMRSRAKAALDFIQTFEFTNPDRIAAIGYCFGGTTVLEMARAGFPLKGVASFHGPLDTPVPAKEGEVKAKVIVFIGADDKSIPAESVVAFEKEMKDAKADFQIVILSGAVHSFTNPESGDDPSTGVAYNKKADERSWEILELFFKEIFLSDLMP